MSGRFCQSESVISHTKALISASIACRSPTQSGGRGGCRGAKFLTKEVFELHHYGLIIYTDLFQQMRLYKVVRQVRAEYNKSFELS